MVVETLDIKEATLVNSRACLNVISHKLCQLLDQICVDLLQVLAQNFTRHTTKFARKDDLKIKVGKCDCLNEFHGMPPRGMMNKVILGEPWQIKHCATLNWYEDAITFKSIRWLHNSTLSPIVGDS